MIDLNTLFSNALTAAITNAVAPLNERIAALEEKVNFLENQAIVTSNAVDTRITALETKLTEANLFTQTANVTIPIDEAKMVEALNSQEWFWEKLRNFIDAATEQAVDNHCETYDHDEYDRHLDDDDKHSDGDIEDHINRALRNATIEISI